MDTELLSEIIAQVIRKLNVEGIKKENKKKVLVFIDGIQSGLSIINEGKLPTEEYAVSILADRETSRILTAAPAERVFILEELPHDSNEWLKQFDNILIPDPSLKIVSKIAHIIIDDKFMEIIFNALEQKKQVFMGQPLESGKTANLTPALRAEIKRLGDKLTDYGIQKLPAKNEKCCTSRNNTMEKTSHVITLRDVADRAENGSELSVSRDAVITPLAMDYLRERKISVTRYS